MTKAKRMPDLLVAQNARPSCTDFIGQKPACGLGRRPPDERPASCESLRHGGGASATIIICGAVCCDQPAARQLIQVSLKINTFARHDDPIGGVEVGLWHT